MSKSLPRHHLKAGVALAVLALFGATALPVAAHGHKHAHKTPRVSQTFREQSKVTAERTVRIIETGTSDAQPPEGVDTRLPALNATTVQTPEMPAEAAGVVTCPGSKTDVAWNTVPEDLRRTARPGECYARLLTTPKLKTYMDHVVVTPERTATRLIPEVTRMVDKDVMVKPERVVRKVIPAVVSKHLETVVVSEATWREETIPARYETHVEHVLIEPARQEWVKAEGVALDAPMVTPDDHQAVRYREDGYLTWPHKDAPERVQLSDNGQTYRRDANSGDIWCLKMIPGVYRDQEVRVVVQPATTHRIEVPAVTREVMRTVIEQPEHVEEHTIPAVYEKRRVKEVVSAEHVETYTVPAVYKDVEKTRVDGPAETVWRRVLCGKNASPALISQVQKALNAKGYDAGRPDGQLGKQTLTAVQKFQADNGLPQGQLSVEVVKALGVAID